MGQTRYWQNSGAGEVRFLQTIKNNTRLFLEYDLVIFRWQNAHLREKSKHLIFPEPVF